MNIVWLGSWDVTLLKTTNTQSTPVVLEFGIRQRRRSSKKLPESLPVALFFLLPSAKTLCKASDFDSS